MLVFIFDFCITVYVLSFIAVQINYLVRMRREYRTSDHPSNYALIVQDIPVNFTTSDMLFDFFDSLFPRCVKSIKFIPLCSKLTKYRREYWTAVRNRQRCNAILQRAAAANSTPSVLDKYIPAALAAKLPDPSRFTSGRASTNSSVSNGSAAPQSSTPEYPVPNLNQPLAQITSDTGLLRFDSLTKLLNHSARAIQRRTLHEPEESLRYWSNKERKLLEKIEDERHHTEVFDANSSTRAAIITFRRKNETSMAAQVCFSSSPIKWFLSPVPDIHAMNWDAFGISIRTVLVRKLAAILLTTTLIIFWVIPTALIQTLANIESLSKTPAFAWLGFVNKLTPEFSGFLQGLLPALVLELVMIVIPKIIRWIVMIQRIPSQVEIEKQVLQNMIAFLFFSHLIYIVLSGSLLEYSDRILRNPSSIVRILGTSIPQQGTFMMNVILLATLVQTPLEVLQIPRLIRRWLGMKRAWTNRDREIVNAGGSLADHFLTYAYGTIFVVLAIVYSTLAPVMIMICALFFAVSYIVIKYNLVYTFTKPWEGFAALHHIALQGITIGLVIKQFTMGGFMSLMGQATLATLEFVVAAVTIVIVVVYTRRVLPILEHGALEDLASSPLTASTVRDVSKKDSSATNASSSDEVASEMYVHPCFSPVKQFDNEDKSEASNV
ncbi:phosphate transporter [Gracilaria domingensis]|nr:phosphate transporter [Gracilaria domingensis]